MAVYLLRIEGVNLDYFVYDTADLSANRGGSLELLSAVRDARLHLESGTGVSDIKALSVGASTALLQFNASLADAGKAADHVRDCLRGVSYTGEQSAEQKLLAEATFVVSLQELADEADFAPARERLLALGRWEQMQAASLAVPPDSAAGETPCLVDALRPVSAGCDWPVERSGKWERAGLSSLAKLRKQYGRRQKQLLYSEITGLARPDGIKFAREFSEIALHVDERAGAGKLAVFYADGNQFGKIQSDKARTPQLQVKWDTELRDRREALLRRLLEDEVLNDSKKEDWLFDRALDDEDGQATGKAEKNALRYRLETLLWGGDELIWVVPAWCAWRVAALFFEETAAWEFEGTKLTHSAGMVICSYKAPIRRITQIARDLADAAKDISRTRNQLAVEVLESFDDISGGVTDMWKRRTPKEEAPAELILDAEHLAAAGNIIAGLRDHPDFPRGQLHDIVMTQVRNGKVAAYDKPREILARRDKRIGDELDKLKACFGGCDWSMWIALQTYWDYADVWPAAQPESSTTTQAA